MNINSSIRNLRYNAPQNLEKNIVDDIKEDVIEEVQVQPLQEPTVEQGYGRASRQQYLANMGIKIVSYSASTAQQKEKTPENPVTEKQVEENTAQISNSRATNSQPTTGATQSNSTSEQVKSIPHIPAASAVATVVTKGGNSISADLYATTGELVQELARMKAENLAMPAEMVESFDRLSSLAQDPKAFEQTLGKFTDQWISTHDLNSMTQEEATQACLKDFYTQELGINVSNILKCIGGAAVVSLLIKVGVSTIIDVAPDICKDAVNWTKDTFKNLFKGNILGLIKNAVIDAPVMLIRNAGRTVRSLAKNTYQTARDVIVAGAKGTYNTVKTAVKGTVETVSKPIKAVAGAASNVLSGVGNGLKKLANGNVIGAVGSVVGGVAKGVGSVVTGVAKTVGSAAKTVVKTAGKAIGAVADVAGEVFGNPIKAVGNAVKSVGKAIGKLFKGW